MYWSEVPSILSLNKRSFVPHQNPPVGKSSAHQLRAKTHWVSKGWDSTPLSEQRVVHALPVICGIPPDIVQKLNDVHDFAQLLLECQGEKHRRSQSTDHADRRRLSTNLRKIYSAPSKSNSATSEGYPVMKVQCRRQESRRIKAFRCEDVRRWLEHFQRMPCQVEIPTSS